MTDTQPDDLRQRIADAIRTAAHDCDGTCDLTEDDCIDSHPIQVTCWTFDTVSAVEGDVDVLADAVLAVVRAEIDQARAEVERLRAALAQEEHVSAERGRYLAEVDAALIAAGQDEGGGYIASARRIRELAAERDRYAELLRQYVRLVAVAHAHPIQGGHDSLGAGLTCASCGIAEQARAALDSTPPPTDEP